MFIDKDLDNFSIILLFLKSQTTRFHYICFLIKLICKVISSYTYTISIQIFILKWFHGRLIMSLLKLRDTYLLSYCFILLFTIQSIYIYILCIEWYTNILYSIHIHNIFDIVVHTSSLNENYYFVITFKPLACKINFSLFCCF